MEAKAHKSIPVRLDILDAKGKSVHFHEFVKDKVVMGRVLSADLRIDDPRVSRIHALLEVKGEQLVVTDLASSHGTFVNGSKVVEKNVKFGDVIKLGFIEVKLTKGSGKVSAAPAFEGAPVFEGEETLVNIDRATLEKMERRDESDRRKSDAFPDEQRLSDRREGERRLDQRKGERRMEGAAGTEMVPEERRDESDRRSPLDYERRVGDRRRDERRVFDITSLERRIDDRRGRKGSDDVLPEELEKAFEAPDHARELEVTALWGDHILDVSNYYTPMVLSVGESPRNDYIIPSVGIPDEFPLVSIEDDGNAYLSFTEDMTGTIRARDRIYTVAELKEEKFIRKNGEYFTLGLKQDDFAKLSIGTVNFFMLYVKPAPRIKPAPWFDRDPLLIRTAIGSFLLLAFILIGMNFVPKPKPVTIEMIPERFQKIVIKKRPEIPKKGIIAKGEESKEGGSKAGEGGPAIGPEGKAGKADLPDKGQVPQAILPQSKPKDSTPPAPQVAKPKEAPKPTQQQRKVVDANKAKSVGLLKAFSQSGVQKDFQNLINQGVGPEGPGGFDEFGKAVSGARGKSIEDTGGAGGKGLKGVDVGGGGKTIGIDGPSTKGLGRGGSGDGIGEGISGPGRLGQKGEHAISIVSENVQVLSGLSKDLINAVVQRHRSEIRACYDAALQRNPSLRGKITIAFTIQPNGIVSYAGVKESTLGDGGLEGCITSRVKTWIFPKPEAPVVTEVSAYPFYLNPAN